MTERQIVYEPHPVTPERKAALVAKGFKIIDARFAPEGYEQPEPEGAGWTVAKLKARLAEIGIAIPRGASKDDMLALLPEDER